MKSIPSEFYLNTNDRVPKSSHTQEREEIVLKAPNHILETIDHPGSAFRPQTSTDIATPWMRGSSIGKSVSNP